MELHDRRAPSGRTGYLVSNDDVARHGAAVFHAPGEFAIVRDRAGSHHDSGDPPRLPGIVFPGVHRRPGQRLPRKRDIAQCEAAVMMGHVATVTGSLTGSYNPILAATSVKRDPPGQLDPRQCPPARPSLDNRSLDATTAVRA